MHPNSSIYTTAAWKKLRFILSVRSDFHMIDNLSIAVHIFVSRVSMSFSVDETLLPRKVNLSTNFREVPSYVEMSPVWLWHKYSALCALTWRPMPAAARYIYNCSLFRFYDISTFISHLMPNPFLYEWSVLFQTIQFSISTQFICQKHFYFKLFSLVKQF